MKPSATPANCKLGTESNLDESQQVRAYQSGVGVYTGFKKEIRLGRPPATPRGWEGQAGYRRKSAVPNASDFDDSVMVYKTVILTLC